MKNPEAHHQNGPEALPSLRSLMENAYRLQSIGLNPIPLRPITPKVKRPFVDIGELKEPPNGFYHRVSTIEDIKEWRHRHKLSTDPAWSWEGLALVTGETSGVFVLDSDGPEGEELIRRHDDPHTWKSATVRGYQRFYRLPKGMKIKSSTKEIHPELDIKGHRGIAVVPPSLHYLGKRYRWINSPFDTLIADPPAWLLSAIKLASGEGITREEEASLPEEIRSYITKNVAKKRRSRGSGGGEFKKNPFARRIPYGQRNIVLFLRACHYKRLGCEEDEIYEKISADNQTSCEPDEEGELLSDEEIRGISKSAYRKQKCTPPEILATLEAVNGYYREKPPRGMAEHTDKDITEAFLQEVLLHGSVISGGIELSISYGCLAEKAGVSDSTLRKALNERLFKDGRFKRGKNPKGVRSGTLILIPSAFYATSAHSTVCFFECAESE